MCLLTACIEVTIYVFLHWLFSPSQTGFVALVEWECLNFYHRPFAMNLFSYVTIGKTQLQICHASAL